MAEICKTCKHWDRPVDAPIEPSTRRDCRVSAPLAGVAEDARWPWTTAIEWCGRWALRSHYKTHGRENG